MTISLSQAFAQWQELAEGIDKDDGPALAESWNDYTDALCKDGELLPLQYQYAPAYDEDMPGEGSRFDELADDREFILSAMGATLSAVFVPWSRSRNKDEKMPSINWRVTLKYRDRDVIETDYMQGCGHCPAYNNPSKFPSGKRDQHVTDNRIRYECNTGFVTRTDGGQPKKKIDPPSVVDVFYSLLRDGDAMNCRDFADWCDEFGMDSDSIKARKTYDDCLAAGLKLRAAFGDKTLSELRDLFADM